MLQHCSYVVPYHIHTDLLHRNAVKTDLPGSWWVEPEDDLHQGGFAAAAGAHQGHLFPRSDIQRYVIQDQRSLSIPERDMLEPQCSSGFSLKRVQLVGIGWLQTDSQ